MTSVAIVCWAAFIDCLISIVIMIRGKIIESYFHKYVAIGLFCISALLLFIAGLLV